MKKEIEIKQAIKNLKREVRIKEDIIYKLYYCMELTPIEQQILRELI